MRGVRIKLLPAMSIRRGRVVIINSEGEYEPLEDDKGKDLSPTELAGVLLDDYKALYLVDINGIESNRPQLDIIRSICALGEVWVDAGVRFADNLIDIVMAGASTGVMSTKSMASLKELVDAVQLSEDVTLCIDWKGKVLSRDKELSGIDEKELAERARGLGIKEIVFADLGRRSGERLDMDLLFGLGRMRINVLYGGCVLKEDVETLRSNGIAGALLDLREIVSSW